MNRHLNEPFHCEFFFLKIGNEDVLLCLRKLTVVRLVFEASGQVDRRVSHCKFQSNCK